LRIAIQGEPKGFIQDLTLDSGSGGVEQPKPIAHNVLVRENDRGLVIPQLATEQISPERGTWRTNPDGTMETVWKIHPNVKWHDGTPFTSEDLLFTFTVFTDPAIPNQVGSAARRMTSAAAPDPYTLVIQWSQVDVEADRAPGLEPLPKHLLEETYRTDKANFLNSPRLSTSFVGLGPYKLQTWEPGSHLQFTRFDEYCQGRPPLDQVTVQFIGDPNTMVANILAEAVDVVLPPAVDLETAVDLKRGWEGTGHQVVIGSSGAFRAIVTQQRPELARPRFAMTNPIVRRALYHAMDRDAMAELLSQGFAPAADSWYGPTHPSRSQLDASIPQHPYDIRRAQQLLAEAGWASRGADGVLVHPSGERLELHIAGTVQRRVEREKSIIADGWKAAGAAVTFYTIPPALTLSREHWATQPGGAIYSRRDFDITVLHSSYIPGPDNGWTGYNMGAYVNPRVDRLYERLSVTIAARERVEIEKELVQEVMGEVPNWPLYWDVSHVLALKGVRGIPTGDLRRPNTWNFFAWDKV
jgi:peptide/nickel transport system substrate-binding protein